MTGGTMQGRRSLRRRGRPFITSLAAVACTGVTACGGGGEETEVARGMGYMVTLPTGWNVGKSEAEVAGFRADSVWVGDTVEGFTVNVNVVRETSLAPDLSLRTYVARHVRVLRGPKPKMPLPGEPTSSAVEDPRPTTLGGEEARRVGFVLTTTDSKRLRVLQVIALRDGIAYNATYAAPADRFRDELSDFEKILASWRWT